MTDSGGGQNSNHVDIALPVLTGELKAATVGRAPGEPVTQGIGTKSTLTPCGRERGWCDLLSLGAKTRISQLKFQQIATVCKVADLEVFQRPFWIWKHIHVQKVHVYEVYAHEMHAYEVHASEVHAPETCP
jgi:hypothetical protein